MTAPTPQTPPHQSAPLSARQAAARLGVNEKTVRRWIDRGELLAVKDASGAYKINIDDLDKHRADHAAPLPHQDAAPAADVSAPTMPQAAPHVAPVDLSPLVDHIAHLEDRVQQLTEAATVWQIRAMQAEEKLKMLTAGDVPDDEPSTRPEPPVSPPQPPGATETAETTPDTSQAQRSWWRRLLGSG